MILPLDSGHLDISVRQDKAMLHDEDAINERKTWSSLKFGKFTSPYKQFTKEILIYLPHTMDYKQNNNDNN